MNCKSRLHLEPKCIIVLCCALCAVCMVCCLLSVDFLEFSPRNRNHHHVSDDVSIILEAVKNRRMCLLPRLNTMLGSSRPLECHRGIYNKLPQFVQSWKVFLLTNSTFLRINIPDLKLLCMNSIVDIVLQFFDEFHVTHSCLLHKCSSLHSQLDCCPLVNRH